MKNFLKKIFTAENYKAGLFITILIGTITLSVSVLGWRILLIPFVIVGIAIIGFITNYIMNKLTGLK